MLAEVPQGPGAGRDDLPEPRAVAVHEDAAPAREVRDAADLVERRDHAAERVLEGDDARRARVHLVAEHGFGADVFQREVPAVAGDDGGDHGAGEGGDAVFRARGCACCQFVERKGTG